MNCSYCGSKDKKYYAQVRADGVKVVAQHCAKYDRSIKGQPFVSIKNFDWNSLPRLGGESAPSAQVSFLQSSPPPPQRLVIGQVGYKPPELPR